MGTIRRSWDEQQHEWIGELIFLCGAFLLGAVLGSFFASGFSAESLLFQNILGTTPFGLFICIHIGLTLIIFLGGFFKIGKIVVPFSIALEGFMIACSVTCFILLYGAYGYWPAIAVWSMSGLAILSIQMLLGCRSALYRNVKRGKGGYASRIHPIDRGYWLCGAAALILILCVGWIHCHWLQKLAGYLIKKIP